MDKKAKKICGFIFCGVVVLGLVLVIVGMFTGIVEEAKLFDEGWGVTMFGVSSPSNVFAIIAFIVTLAGLALAIVEAILRLFVNKSIKLIGLIAGIAAIVGGILVLVACIIMANADVYMGQASIGVGAILAFIGGILGGICAILPAVGPFKE